MFTVLSCAIAVVLICVGIHYRALVALSSTRQPEKKHPRWWINVIIIGALLAHVVEMSIFAVTYAVLCQSEHRGGIFDSAGEVSTDYWYFSFVVYTSLGFGDLTPSGDIRMMTALETLTGLVLIAWTASFVFVEMQAWDSKYHRGSDDG